MSQAAATRSPGYPNLRRSRAAAFGVSLLAAAALLVPAAVAATSLPQTVTVSWQLPVAPDVDLGVAAATPTNFADIFPQVYVAQIDGANLGSEALLPACGYVQEDVYRLQSQADVDLLASLEANGLTLTGGQPGDQSILQDWIFEYAGDCQSPTPSDSASPSDSATPTPSDSATPTPSDSATPTGSAEASSGTATPTGSADASSGTPGVTPPATSTDGSSGGSGDGALLLVLALMALGTTGVLVLVPSPASRRR